MISRDIGILGYGQSIYEKKTERHLFDFLADASRSALQSAGLRMTDIDGFAVGSFQLPPDNAVTLAEQFGISLGWSYLCSAGSGAPIAAVLNAIRAIEAGHAEYVLIVAGDAYDPQGLFNMMDELTGPIRDYLTPHGFGGPNGLFALVTQKHMKTFGTSWPSAATIWGWVSEARMMRPMRVRVRPKNRAIKMPTGITSMNRR